MRFFEGSLNYSSLYKRNWFDVEGLRFCKWAKINELSGKHNPLKVKWYKKDMKLINPSWAKSLYNHGGLLTYSSRNENYGRKHKRINLFPWRKNEFI